MKRLLLFGFFIQFIFLHANKSHVNTGALPNFMVSKDSICSKEYVVISDLTIGNATSYTWNFGKDAFPANASGKGPFLVKYSSSGFKKITLTIDGNIEKIKDSAVFVKISPKAFFTINDTDQCIANNIYFFNNLSLNSSKYHWRLGDSITKNTQNVTYSYIKSGNFKVTLISTSNLECHDTIANWVNVFSVPKANFIISNSIQCLNENNFKISNTTKSTKPFNTIFLLGDGNGRLEDSFYYQYDLKGQFTILLKVSAGSGCEDTISKTVRVIENPISNFKIINANQCLNNNLFEYNNESINASSSKWFFGDNTMNVSTNISHSYKTEGVYKVALVSIANNLCVDTSILYANVYPSPICSFKINDSTQCLNSNLFVFEATSIISNGNITNSWILPNGNEVIKNIYQDIYGVPGIFKIKLLAKSDKNCTDTMVKEIMIFDNPNPFFIVDSTNDKSIYLEAIDKSHKYYDWMISDGYKSNSNSFSHLFNTNGIFKIQLIVKDINDCVDSSYYFHTINALDYQIFENQILLYPNPSHTNCTLKVILENKGNISFQLYNFLGQLVYENQKLNCRKGIHYFDIPLESNQLSKGMYWLKINNGKESKIEKILFR